MRGHLAKFHRSWIRRFDSVVVVTFLDFPQEWGVAINSKAWILVIVISAMTLTLMSLCPLDFFITNYSYHHWSIHCLPLFLALMVC